MPCVPSHDVVVQVMCEARRFLNESALLFGQREIHYTVPFVGS
jgi:hypothetical protein